MKSKIEKRIKRIEKRLIALETKKDSGILIFVGRLLVIILFSWLILGVGLVYSIELIGITYKSFWNEVFEKRKNKIKIYLEYDDKINHKRGR